MDHPCPSCGSFVYFVIAGSPDCECSCGHHWKRESTPALRSITDCGSSWDEGTLDELRATLEEAIAKDDRILVLSVRRGKLDGEPQTMVRATMDRKTPCAVTWCEMVGVLSVKLHQWVSDTGEED